MIFRPKPSGIQRALCRLFSSAEFRCCTHLKFEIFNLKLLFFTPSNLSLILALQPYSQQQSSSQLLQALSSSLEAGSIENVSFLERESAKRIGGVFPAQKEVVHHATTSTILPHQIRALQAHAFQQRRIRDVFRPRMGRLPEIPAPRRSASRHAR